MTESPHPFLSCPVYFGLNEVENPVPFETVVLFAGPVYMIQ